MSRVVRRLFVTVVLGALALPLGVSAPADATPGDATARVAERLAKQVLRDHVCGDVVVQGHHLGRVDCNGARDGVEDLARALGREVRDHVCGDVVVQGHHLGRVDCNGARDGVEELERALLRELRDLAR